jgi:hypothetical protein
MVLIYLSPARRRTEAKVFDAVRHQRNESKGLYDCGFTSIISAHDDRAWTKEDGMVVETLVIREP